MLVLSRKLNQSIQIGDDIEVKIIAIEGDQVKVGIEAPKHIDIHRKEVYLSIQEENSRLLACPLIYFLNYPHKKSEDFFILFVYPPPCETVEVHHLYETLTNRAIYI